MKTKTKNKKKQKTHISGRKVYFAINKQILK